MVGNGRAEFAKEDAKVGKASKSEAPKA
jgi:hypothetical protein